MVIWEKYFHLKFIIDIRHLSGSWVKCTNSNHVAYPETSKKKVIKQKIKIRKMVIPCQTLYGMNKYFKQKKILKGQIKT